MSVCGEVVPSACLPLSTPVLPDVVRFACTSDTHHPLSDIPVPACDVLLHAGDLTRHGTPRQMLEVCAVLERLRDRGVVVVVVAGNHDWCVDPRGGRYREGEVRRVRAVLGGSCVYLEDSGCEVWGISLWGSPYTTTHGRKYIAFQREPRDLRRKWDLVPPGIDILLTHGPPHGVGDLTANGTGHAGCPALLSCVQGRVRPVYHVYGHIHEGYGVYTDGRTTYINASHCAYKYQGVNDPVVFDVPLRAGYSKQDRVITRGCETRTMTWLSL